MNPKQGEQLSELWSKIKREHFSVCKKKKKKVVISEILISNHD